MTDYGIALHLYYTGRRKIATNFTRVYPIGKDIWYTLWCLTGKIKFGCYSKIIDLTIFAHRDWVNKVERIRSRNTDAESWKEAGEERSESKNSWADSGEPRAPSPGSVTQYNKTGPSQDYQVSVQQFLVDFQKSRLCLCGLYMTCSNSVVLEI